MKCVFITILQIFGKVNSGGVQVSRRNYDLLCETIGCENVYTVRISDISVSDTTGRDMELEAVNNVLHVTRLAVSALRGSWNYDIRDERKIVDFVKRINPDMVWIDCSRIGKLAKAMKEFKPMVFFHNVETEYAKNKMHTEGAKYWMNYAVMKYNERCAVKYATAITCINCRDGEQIQKLYGRKYDFLLPVTFKDIFDESRLNLKRGKELLFIGSLFDPNYDGIKWFIENVMPGLDGFHLTIVGRRFEEKRAELEALNNGVTVVGGVDDLSEYYYTYPAMVMPIRFGSGMKVKTAEAMMYGKTIFAMREALVGYDVENVDGVYECNTVVEFVDRIKQCFDDTNQIFYKSQVRKLFLDNYEDEGLKRKIIKYLSEYVKKE